MSFATEIDTNVLTCAFDATRDVPILEAKGKSMLCVKVMIPKKKFVLKIAATTVNENIEVNNFGSHILAVTIDDFDQAEALGKLADVFKTVPGLDDWTMTDLLKDNDRLYLKLKEKGSSYLVRTNLKLNSKTLNNSGLGIHQPVVIEAEPMAYFNAASKTYGMYLDLRKLVFEKLTL